MGFNKFLKSVGVKPQDFTEYIYNTPNVYQHLNNRGVTVKDNSEKNDLSNLPPDLVLVKDLDKSLVWCALFTVYELYRKVVLGSYAKDLISHLNPKVTSNIFITTPQKGDMLKAIMRVIDKVDSLKSDLIEVSSNPEFYIIDYKYCNIRIYIVTDPLLDHPIKKEISLLLMHKPSLIEFSLLESGQKGVSFYLNSKRIAVNPIETIPLSANINFVDLTLDNSSKTNKVKDDSSKKLEPFDDKSKVKEDSDKLINSNSVYNDLNITARVANLEDKLQKLLDTLSRYYSP